MFITFEGAEGSGKTTQIQLLANALRAHEIDVTTTREPGGTRIGNAIRSLLLDLKHTEISPRTETLLFQAARAQLVDEVILPALAAGTVVLCDRYADSTLAYQGYGRGQVIAVLRSIGAYATRELTPDLTIYLDIDADAGLARKRAGAVEEWNRMENLEVEFHRRVRDGYLTLAAEERVRWLVIDASQPVDAIHRAILARVLARLGDSSES